MNPPLVILYFFGPIFFDRLAEEVDIGFLTGIWGATNTPGAGATGRGGLMLVDAGGSVESAETGLRVEVRTVGGDLVAALREDDVAGRDCAVLALEALELVRVELSRRPARTRTWPLHT